jgi:hypothetical protein
MMMRRIMLIALLSFTCFPLVAQHITFFNYLNYTSKWQYRKDYNGINGVHGYNEIVYTIEGDTLIEGNWYYKIIRRGRNIQQSPVYMVGPVHRYFAYALRETPDSLFDYRYPDGTSVIVSQSPSAWSGNNILNAGGQIPHRVYWSDYHPIQGWIEGIGQGQDDGGQFGGQYPYELLSEYFLCFTRDSLSTDLTGDTCIIADLLTSAEESLAVFDFTLSPNPASDFVTVTGVDQIHESINLLIYTSDGRQVLTYDGTGEAPLDIHTLNSGIYFVHIRSGEKRYTSRLVVCR